MRTGHMKRFLICLAVCLFLLPSALRAEVEYYDATGKLITEGDYLDRGKGEAPKKEKTEDAPFFEKAVLNLPTEMWNANEGMRLIHPQSGFIDVVDSYDKFFRYSGTVFAPDGGTVAFTRENCVLYSPGGEPYEEYYVRIDHQSQGAKVKLLGRVFRKTFRVRENPERRYDITEWGTVRLGSSDAGLVAEMPKEGYIRFDILWKVGSRFYMGGLTVLGKVIRPSQKVSLKKKNSKRPSLDVEDVPKYKGTLKGKQRISISNPNNFVVTLMIRGGGKGKDAKLTAQSDMVVSIPDGDYETYLVYSKEPKTAFQGEEIKIRGRGVRLEILDSEDGNFKSEWAE